MHSAVGFDTPILDHIMAWLVPLYSLVILLLIYSGNRKYELQRQQKEQAEQPQEPEKYEMRWYNWVGIAGVALLALFYCWIMPGALPPGCESDDRGLLGVSN